MNAFQRLADALRVGKKVRGHRTPVYRPDGTLDHYGRQHVKIDAADLHEVASAAAVTSPDCEIVLALRGGSKGHKAGATVTIQADDLFHLLEKAGGDASPAASVVPTPAPVAE